MTKDRARFRWKRPGRVARTIGAALGALVVVAAAGSVLLSIAAVRSRIVSEAISRLDAALPGDLTVRRVSSRSISSFDLQGISWVDGRDSMVTAERLSISADFLALLDRDIHLEDLKVEGAFADVPAIQARFRKPKDRPPSDDRSSVKEKEEAFPRGGSLPGIPSLAVDRFRATGVRVVTGDSAAVTCVRIDGGFDVRRRNSPWVRVDTLVAGGTEGTWRIDGLSLYAAPERGVLRGRGSGAASPYWPIRFSITPLGKDRFAIDLASSGSESTAAATDSTDGGAGASVGKAPSVDPHTPQSAAGMHLDLTLTRKDLRLEAASFHGSVRTPGTLELSRDPAVAPHVAHLPVLDGIVASFRGNYGRRDKVSGDLSLAIEENNWIAGGEISLRYVEGALYIDKFGLAVPDLSVEGAASMDSDSLRASAKVRVGGARWLHMLFPDFEPPEPLSASIGLTAALAVRSSLVRARVAADATAGTMSVEGLRADADYSLDGRASSTLVLTARTAGLYFGIAGEFRRSPDILANLAPIVVRESPIRRGSLAPRPDRKGGAPGTIRYSTTDGSLAIDGLRIRSDFGDAAVDAKIDGTRKGVFSVRYDVRTPPPPLVRAMKLTPGQADSLGALWSPDAPFRISVDGELLSADGPRVAASGSFSLPGPRNLALALPDSARIDDLGPLAGTFSVSTVPDPAGLGIHGTLNLGPTDWIDSSAVRIRARGGDILVDTLGVASGGIKVGLIGSIARGGQFGLSVALAVEDSLWCRRFGGSLTNVALRGRLDVGGTTRKPVLKADLAGKVAGRGYEVPEFTAVVDLDTTRAAAVIRAPVGVKTRPVRLGRASITVVSTGERAGLLPVRVSLEATGEKFGLHQSLRADTTEGLRVDVDTLSLTLGNQDLRLRRPFRIFLPAGSKGISIEELDLAGSLGTVRASARLDPDSSNVSGVASIALPDEPPPALSRPHLWPEQIDVEFHAEGKSDVDARVDVGGFMLVDQRRPRLHVDIGSHEEWVTMELSIADSSGELVGGRGRFPAAVRIYPPSFSLRDGAVAFEALLNRFPVVATYIGPTERIPQDEILRVSGRAVAGGTAAVPDAVAKLSVEFSDWPKLSRYGAGIEAVLGSRAGADSLNAASAVGVSRELTGALEGGAARGLAASLELTREGGRVLSARVVYPLRVSLFPPAANTAAGGRFDARVESKRLPLGDFDPFLPLNVGLGGALALVLAGKGPVEDFALDGSVGTQDLEVSVAEQARFVARSNIAVSGSKRRPVIRGDVEVTSGLIRVPDRPKHLHEIEGDALLWPDSLSRAERDTVTAGRSEGTKSAVEPARTFDTDLDVSIHIPSGFWIRGKGLDIELSGDLVVTQKGGKPVVTGELRAIRGTLIALGRTLELERGTVTFYGGDEINPSLDFVLTTDIEGTKIEILFGGTAQKPRINLTSAPEMPESDVMAVLLFGRTFEALDDEEADLVKRRSAEMIASLGAAKLQEELGGQLGVDVVTIKDIGMGSESSALSLGKYLNPRTVLSYAYSLDTESRSFVSLEYFLKGRFVLVSTYDNEGVGSVGMGWSKDFGGHAGQRGE